MSAGEKAKRNAHTQPYEIFVLGCERIEEGSQEFCGTGRVQSQRIWCIRDSRFLIYRSPAYSRIRPPKISNSQWQILFRPIFGLRVSPYEMKCRADSDIHMLGGGEPRAEASGSDGSMSYVLLNYKLSRLLGVAVVQQIWKANITRLHRARVWWSKLIFLNYVTDRPRPWTDICYNKANGQVGSSEHVACHDRQRRTRVQFCTPPRTLTNLPFAGRARPNVAIILEVAPHPQ